MVLFGSLLLRGLTARGARTGPGLALKKVTTKGCWERGACCPSRPARPGSTLRPETERAERAVTRGWGPARGHSRDLSVGGPGARSLRLQGTHWASVSSSEDPSPRSSPSPQRAGLQERGRVLGSTGSGLVMVQGTARCDSPLQLSVSSRDDLNQSSW